MTERTLRGCRILVVEDEYMLADELRTELCDAGAIVIGPVATLAEALALVESGQALDGAILDVNLGGEMVFPVADLLLARNVPFVLATGYEGSTIPGLYAHVVRLDKPANVRLVTQAIGRAIHA